MRHVLPLVVALLILVVFAGPAAATTGGGALFGGYWGEFVEYWQGVFQKQNGIVMGVLAVGAVGIFIITRGKWQK